MLIQKRQDAMSPRRLNASNIARISTVISPTDPDLILLVSIVEGVSVFVDERGCTLENSISLNFTSNINFNESDSMISTIPIVPST